MGILFQPRWEASLIVPRLFLGSFESARVPDEMHAHGITHVLSMAKQCPPRYPDQFAYLHIHAYDSIGENLLAHTRETNAFIDQGRAAGGVLVHCVAGISRSSTAVMAYLLWKAHQGVDGMPADMIECYDLVRAGRPQAEPNIAFKMQLLLYEQMGCTVEGTSPAHLKYRAKWILLQRYRDGALTADALTRAPPREDACVWCAHCGAPLCARTSTFWDHSLSPRLHVEPMQWMHGIVDRAMGDVVCACGAALGHYSWKGEQHDGNFFLPCCFLLDEHIEARMHVEGEQST